MPDDDRPALRHSNRWPLALPLTAALTAASATALLAVTAPTGRGDPHPAVGVSAPAPGSARRLDRDQLRLGEAQAIADAFAGRFAAYLDGATPADHLRRAGATRALVQRIGSGARRGSRTIQSRGLQPADVVVRSNQGGWLASTSLGTNARRQPSDKARVPLNFRLEVVNGRVAVVDVNPGGGE